eukprot:gnl/MRDRNA2_/MRDRNA2_79732_c0_seq1.p1 gnl/MRDRNA2_/MRDRNA2_79732_c0~~gnl/MRDRNA2_/MRDRNA2_79732_c0_seq1.p1  ORF type:complete len:357 (+),score=47.58 gnl/MRDRNA2_/MRDRNA2_79732_c0_seq1:27-1073(+)
MASTLLLISRFCMGVGDINSVIIGNLGRRLFPVAEQTSKTVLVVLANTLGMGMGPAFGSASEMLASCVPDGDKLPGYISAATASVGIYLVGFVSLLEFPSLETVRDFTRGQRSADAESEIPHGGGDTTGMQSHAGPRIELTPEELMIVSKRQHVISACLVMTASRAFCIASLEAATSLIFEIEYNLAPVKIGYLVSFCFCCTPIFKSAYDFFEHVTVENRLRALMVLSTIGGSMMLVTGSVAVLCAADVLLFPSFFLTEGIMQGYMQEHAFPTGKGYLLNVNSLSLAIGILINGLGRGLGPPLARLLVQQGGQVQYAGTQLVMCIVGCIILEYVLLNRVEPEAIEAID